MKELITLVGNIGTNLFWVILLVTLYNTKLYFKWKV